ncbi:hypothetical protein HXX76_011914 [Chlamydomonas incerta]|uniref:Ubiquitin-like protease family profile domain-containing protein n=1 Tax=Chlamydomonas incerta TaxID=51695 RepID=A0A835SIR4_CHLIN|nr:hypothetical protein HXX76_011914 [Chlamydomonas incerta]|eukprot:KAG2427927.1 hypothetical protein HXX76_011914 [Chlamydomonas incerta]
MAPKRAAVGPSQAAGSAPAKKSSKGAVTSSPWSMLRPGREAAALAAADSAAGPAARHPRKLVRAAGLSSAIAPAPASPGEAVAAAAARARAQSTSRAGAAAVAAAAVRSGPGAAAAAALLAANVAAAAAPAAAAPRATVAVAGPAAASAAPAARDMGVPLALRVAAGGRLPHLEALQLRRPRPRDGEVVAKVRDGPPANTLDLTAADLRRLLQPGAWLSDQPVNFYMLLIRRLRGKRQAPRPPPRRRSSEPAAAVSQGAKRQVCLPAEPRSGQPRRHCPRGPEAGAEAQATAMAKVEVKPEEQPPSSHQCGATQQLLDKQRLKLERRRRFKQERRLRKKAEAALRAQGEQQPTADGLVKAEPEAGARKRARVEGAAGPGPGPAPAACPGQPARVAEQSRAAGAGGGASAAAAAAAALAAAAAAAAAVGATSPSCVVPSTARSLKGKRKAAGADANLDSEEPAAGAASARAASGLSALSPSAPAPPAAAAAPAVPLPLTPRTAAPPPPCVPLPLTPGTAAAPPPPPPVPPPLVSVYAFNSFFFACLTGHGRSRSALEYAAVQRWTLTRRTHSPDCVLGRELLLFPINHRNAHWWVPGRVWPRRRLLLVLRRLGGGAATARWVLGSLLRWLARDLQDKGVDIGCRCGVGARGSCSCSNSSSRSSRSRPRPPCRHCGRGGPEAGCGHRAAREAEAARKAEAEVAALVAAGGWRLEHMTGKLPRQLDGTSCGLFVCAYAELLARGVTPGGFRFAQGDMGNIRRGVAEQILRCSLRKFPAPPWRAAGLAILGLRLLQSRHRTGAQGLSQIEDAPLVLAPALSVC